MINFIMQQFTSKSCEQFLMTARYPMYAVECSTIFVMQHIVLVVVNDLLFKFRQVIACCNNGLLFDFRNYLL